MLNVAENYWAEDGAAWRKRAGEHIEAHYRRKMGLSLAPKEHPMGQEQQLTSIGIGRLSFCSGFSVHIITCTIKLSEPVFLILTNPSFF